MFSLLPPLNNIKNNIVLYGKNRYLGSLIESNNDSLLSYATTHPWTLPNQHPLVKFLILLSVDIYKSDEFIFNEIAYKYKQIASACQLTSLTNSGTSFIHCLFPEKDHRTLFVVPFLNDVKMEDYFTQPFKNIVALTTIYTTDTTIRYDTTSLSNKQTITTKSDYTVVQVDPFALVIGYVRYCRDLVSKDSYTGLSARMYLSTSPLANFFIQHNQYVFTNLIDGDGIKTDTTKWNKVDISRELGLYLAFQRRHESIVQFKSFQHYINMLSQGDGIGDKLIDSIYPANGISSGFNQLSWVYNYGEMGWSYKYMGVLKKYGKTDKVFVSNIKRFLKNDIKYLTASIKEPYWKNLYINMYKDLIEIVK